MYDIQYIVINKYNFFGIIFSFQVNEWRRTQKPQQCPPLSVDAVVESLHRRRGARICAHLQFIRSAMFSRCVITRALWNNCRFTSASLSFTSNRRGGAARSVLSLVVPWLTGPACRSWLRTVLRARTTPRRLRYDLVVPPLDIIKRKCAAYHLLHELSFQ